MKKLVVNGNACIGCGACVAIDGEHFAFNEEGLSTAISQENLESKNVSEAIDACPTSAIRLEEVDAQCHCECASKEEHTCQCGDCHCEDDHCDCGDDCHCEDCHCENEKAA